MANSMPKITMEGDKEFFELVKTLPGRLVTEVKGAMKDTGTKIARKARTKLTNNHGYFSGLIKKSLGVRHIKFYPKDNRIVMYVGTRQGHTQTVKFKDGSIRKHNPHAIAHLVEFGHRIVTEEQGKAAKSGFVITPNEAKGERQGFTHDSTVKPRPFLRPAVDEMRPEYLRAMTEKIKKVIAKRAAKAAKV